MSEEEYMECSVVAYPRQIKFLHINGGAISYYVDRHVSDYVDRLQQENQELKKQLEEKQNPLKGIFAQVNDDTLLRNCGNINAEINELKNQQKKFIEYLENEKNRLAMECSHIYEDSLGKTRLVNEDIFNEVDTILSKYKSIIGGK